LEAGQFPALDALELPSRRIQTVVWL